MTLVERLREPRTMSQFARMDDLYAELNKQRAEAADEIERLENALETAREALEPFAKVGKLIDGPFGPALFADDDDAFKSGCAWKEDGETKTLTWGNFRCAVTAIRTLSQKKEG